jgi:3-dehydroquinate synthetase
MVLALSLSVQRGILGAGPAQRIVRLLRRLTLPTRIDLDPAAVISALGKDKKREADNIHFVLLSDIGSAVVREIALKDLARFLEAPAFDLFHTD